MTSPDGASPDGSLALGLFAAAQALTAEDALAAATGGALGGFEDAQESWWGHEDDVAQQLSDFHDSQLDMLDRLDLLEGVSGYCNLFMGKNWRVKGGSRVTLPFDTQLGPAKGATPEAGGIRLGGKGLWRADCHVSFYPAPSNWFTGAGAVSLQVFLQVSTLAGVRYTEHEFDIVITQHGAETAAFSHTFVIPTDDAYRVIVQVQHPKDWHWVYGGTLRSSLSVNKWDNGTSNAVVLPTAPDGGELTA